MGEGAVRWGWLSRRSKAWCGAFLQEKDLKGRSRRGAEARISVCEKAGSLC